MDIPISHASFTRRPLAVRTGGWFRGPKILQDGHELNGKRGRFEARDDSYLTRVLKLKGHFLDPLPSFSIDGDPVALGRPLTWYEYAWLGLPIVLVVDGGALGAMLGIGAAHSSARIFRSDRSAIAKYALSGLMSLAAGIIFLVIATAIELARR